MNSKYLYQLLVIIFICVITILSSCNKFCANNYPCQPLIKDSIIIITNIETSYDTMYNYIPVDSNAIKAEIYCDSNLRVIFKPIYFKDRKKEISLEVENGKLIYKYKSFKDSLMSINRTILRTLEQKEIQIKQAIEKHKEKSFFDYLLYFILLIIICIIFIQCLRR